ncbi:MAG TPA: ABC transporter substrate-binding protein [Thermotogota bacterium]|jgi:ribose transport system substrate-binding protein|nr:ABC transporter substrate-binding protein [Thermotogota bacterium]NLH18963.1 ABC transporter substrate-binding protein [Thermotogaceae bacterium]OQC32772.1 MAG: D-ribose-binding periplasmic protein precursor [Thermotogota bacterium ADurb.Bin062]HNW46634.1 ABC transporter substrate-binding protein [Thermotogota bacterium]HNY82627.1 ABC transporter substrate-binding protein [Thermotogota bacterium]
MKKALLMVLVVTLLLSSFAFSAPKIRIGVSIPTADHGWTGGINWWAQKAIKEWQAKDPDVTFFLVTADSPAKQVADVEDLMVKGIDALVILAHDSAPLTPIVEKVYNEGIFVVSVDRGLTKPVEHVYVAGDNPGLGRVSAEWMAKELNYKGSIVVLEGIPCVINSERVDAFNEVMKKYPNIKILDSQPAYWSTQKGLEIMENYLQKYDKIDAVWAQDDDVLKGVLQAYKESRRKDILFFLGGAGSKEIIKMVMDGDKQVRADVTYPPSMIGTGISMAVMSLRGEKLNGFYQNQIPSKIILAAELITVGNAKSYYEPDSIF